MDLREELEKKENMITKSEGEKLAKDIKAYGYYETSSKTGAGVKELFDELVRIHFSTQKPKSAGLPLTIPLPIKETGNKMDLL